MRLDNYSPKNYSPGASVIKQLLWFFIGDRLVQTSLIPVSIFKVFILRLFGAKIGQGVNLKPGVKIKFPWRLAIADHVWIGEKVWIDNIFQVTIETNVCISQDVYLCTGNHSWSKTNFELIPGEIYLEESSWIAARAVIGPGVRVGQGAVLSLGSVATQSLKAMTIYAGNPAQAIKERNLV
ncbi:MAG: WcaF family extracellular polysaccharide biosynthesis acetyltransferase [Microcystaceae cyanobacterium]